MHKEREADHPIHHLFIDRWSPRSFTSEAMPTADLLTLLEAARWAPSCYNIQPWRFLYAERDDAHWADFLDGLVPFNRSWAETASALVYVLSDSMMPAQGADPAEPAAYNSFDAGAAATHLALQATMLGYHAHAMAGLRPERAREILGVPARYKLEVALAIGRRADPAQLPAALREREHPSDRRPLDETAFAGPFPAEMIPVDERAA